MGKKEYLSTVVQLQLNHEYVAVSMEGKVRVHKIQEREEDVAITFPEGNRKAKIISSSLTPHFLIFSTDVSSFPISW